MSHEPDASTPLLPVPKSATHPMKPHGIGPWIEAPRKAVEYNFEDYQCDQCSLLGVFIMINLFRLQSTHYILYEFTYEKLELYTHIRYCTRLITIRRRTEETRSPRRSYRSRTSIKYTHKLHTPGKWSHMLW